MSLIDYLESKFKISSSGDNVRVKCPFCSEKKKDKTLSFSLDKNLFNCFRCDYSGSALAFVIDQEKCSIPEAIEIIGTSNTSLKKKLKEDSIALPGYYKTLILSKSNSSITLQHGILSYLKRRGLQKKDILRYNIGYGFKPNQSVVIVFPLYDHKHQLTGYIEKPLGTKGQYYITSNKSKGLYNIQNAKNYHTIVICEGVFDCFAIGDQSVALLGKTLSNDNLDFLRTLKKDYIICLDSDAFENSLNIAKKLSSSHNVGIVKLPEGKDPSDMKDEIKDYIQKNVKIFDERMRF